MADISVSIADIRAMAAHMNTAAVELENRLRLLQEQVTILGQNWSGPAAAAFKSKYEEWAAEALRVSDHLNDISARLAETAILYAEIDIQIYVSEASAGPGVENSLKALLHEFGASDYRESDVVLGSWYRSMVATFKQAAESDAAATSKRAIELQVLERFQAGVDGMTGNTVANILPTLNGTRRAAIQIGSILIVKVDDCVVVRQLSPREMLHWRENPGLFKDPASALVELQRANVIVDDGTPSYLEESSGNLSGETELT